MANKHDQLGKVVKNMQGLTIRHAKPGSHLYVICAGKRVISDQPYLSIEKASKDVQGVIDMKYGMRTMIAKLKRVQISELKFRS